MPVTNGIPYDPYHFIELIDFPNLGRSYWILHMNIDHPYTNLTRNRILSAAILSFADRGYDGAGIREITARAGVNTSLVNYHFGSKVGLYQEVLRYILRHKSARLIALANHPPFGPTASRQEILQKLKDYIRDFLESIMPTGPTGPLDDASMAILCREMEAPSPMFAALVQEFVQPMALYLDQLLAALRPDLDEPGRFIMSMSVQGQMVHLRNALGMVRLLRSDPVWPRDLGSLVHHFTNFSLRGLGIAEAPEDPALDSLPVS